MVAMDVDREEGQQSSCKSPPDNGISSPRISFSCDLADDASFISINLAPVKTEENDEAKQISSKNFEFSSSDRTRGDMPTADELFFEGKLLPYWQTHHSEKLKSLSCTSSEIGTAAEITVEKAEEAVTVKEESRVRTWFIDDDPSPRPPKCTVLWKELLRLKTRQKSSSLSPSSSSSSSSSSSELDVTKEKSRDSNAGSKNVKRMKKGLERTRSASIRIRPMVNVPICTLTAKQSYRPPLFPSKRER